MSTIEEYTQRLLNAGELKESELPDIMEGRVTEADLRSRGIKLDVDTHPARTAVLLAAKSLSKIDQETTYYADFVELFVASLQRFMQLPSVILPVAIPAPTLEQKHGLWGVSQRVTGDVSIVDGILARDRVFLALASRYAGFDLTEMDEDTVDALEEFLNVVNGLFIVELANRKFEPDLEFPRAAEDVIPRGSHQLALRLYTAVGHFLLILSTDAFL